MKCKNCNESLEPDWRECPVCETAIDQSFHCSNCGKEIKPQWVKCPLCLSRIEKHSNDTVTDIDGNEYRTIIIGNQEWMAENLRTKRYRNGQAIPTGLSNTQWENTTSGAYAVHPYQNADGLNSHEEVVEAYGILYNWYAVDDSRGLCPEGWLVPTDAEWQQLIDHLMDTYGFHNNPLSNDIDGVGNKLRSRRQFNSPLGEPWATDVHPRWGYSHGTHFGTDDFGFSGLPSGGRGDDGSVRIGYISNWWSYNKMTPDYSFVWGLLINHGHLYRGGSPHIAGLSVRCIRN